MNPRGADPAEQAPNCRQCRFFAVTWEPAHPYACKTMGFKTRLQPSLEVFRADGRHCQSYALRPTTAGASAAAPVAHRSDLRA